MSKAEKFIQDCTNHGSNKMESPLHANPKLNFYSWLHPEQARKAVEIAREEIYEWLKENADSYTWYNEFEGESGMTSDFIDRLRQAMKYECK